jgi:undecaprenyl-diphosphatase
MKTSTRLSKDNLKLRLVCLTFLVALMFILFFRAEFAIIDLHINLWAPSIQSSAFTYIALAVSYAFDTYSLLAITVGVATYLFFKNHKGESLLLLGAMGGDALIVTVFKALVHSPRPLNELILDSGYSFPSGHTTGSIVFCGLLAYFAWQHWKGPKARLLLAASSVTITVTVGFDRIYLNVHWFSDVLGGCMLGIFWLAFSILAFKYLKTRGIFRTK